MYNNGQAQARSTKPSTNFELASKLMHQAKELLLVLFNHRIPVFNTTIKRNFKKRSMGRRQRSWQDKQRVGKIVGTSQSENVVNSCLDCGGSIRQARSAGQTRAFTRKTKVLLGGTLFGRKTRENVHTHDGPHCEDRLLKSVVHTRRRPG